MESQKHAFTNKQTIKIIRLSKFRGRTLIHFRSQKGAQIVKMWYLGGPFKIVPTRGRGPRVV